MVVKKQKMSRWDNSIPYDKKGGAGGSCCKLTYNPTNLVDFVEIFFTLIGNDYRPMADAPLSQALYHLWRKAKSPNFSPLAFSFR